MTSSNTSRGEAVTLGLGCGPLLPALTDFPAPSLTPPTERCHVQSPSSIPFAELAIINGLDMNAQLRAGQMIKRVTGTAAPRVTSTP